MITTKALDLLHRSPLIPVFVDVALKECETCIVSEFNGQKATIYWFDDSSELIVYPNGRAIAKI